MCHILDRIYALFFQTIVDTSLYISENLSPNAYLIQREKLLRVIMFFSAQILRKHEMYFVYHLHGE